MKVKNPEKKQQLQLFLKELVTFALLFAALGLVVYFFFYQSVYRDINSGFTGQKQRILQNVPQPKWNHLRGTQTKSTVMPTKDGPFRADIVVFNSKGKIMNQAMLGERDYSLLKKTKLNVKDLDKVQELTLSSDDVTSHFRTLLIKVPASNLNPMYAGRYVLIMENVDADLLALNSFRNALLVTLIIFWILAIAIAYLLSRSSMKPIITSWRKQRDFSANAAHELRTPLTVIQNQLEYLLTKPKSRVMDEIDEVATALDEVNHMQTLTNRLLLLARSDSNVIQINPAEVDLQQWLTQVTKPYQEIAMSQQKSFQSSIKVAGKGKLDADLIRQLITILMDNAIKYTPEHGTVSIKATKVHDNLQLEVADTGEGIADEDKTKVFDRFYRTDKSRNSKTGGNGLGLAIAHWIVGQHKGKLYVRDNHPHGAVFVVSIPL